MTIFRSFTTYQNWRQPINLKSSNDRKRHKKLKKKTYFERKTAFYERCRCRVSYRRFNDGLGNAAESTNRSMMKKNDETNRDGEKNDGEEVSEKIARSF